MLTPEIIELCKQASVEQDVDRLLYLQHDNIPCLIESGLHVVAAKFRYSTPCG
jgi:hypothetical protein